MRFLIITIYALAVLISACNFPLKRAENQELDSEEIAKSISEQKKSDKMDEDASFVVDSYDESMLLFKSAILAKRNAQSDQVKLIALQVILDQSKISAQLSALANQKNIALPDSLGYTSSREYDHLVSLKGKKFDREFVDLVLNNSGSLISDFNQIAEKSVDQDVKKIASVLSPTLKSHYSDVKNLNYRVNAK
ncbi:DUF4142 domain-containing protein [Solitalea koreensis]|uniref:DUF4142 domain-containing protein n=1 Tax=Solitalea koreensis TaxID=543615 RepID=A0A521ARX7_9SPHI|nr:DUF4142 domain-containing protein [Solitalea koreensis]SMO37584.1 protein of unknown function [Solitalea koreensis]